MAEKGRFRKAVEAWYDDFDLGGRFSRYSAEKAHNVEQDVVGENKEVLDIIKSVETGDKNLDNYLRKISNPDKPALLAVVVPVIVGFLMAIVQGIAIPITRLVSYGIDRKVVSARHDLSIWLALQRRGLFIDNHSKTDLGDKGFSDTRISELDLATQIRPGINELILLLRRGEITENDFMASLQQEGIDTNKAGEFIASRQVDPGLSDLLTLAVREAYNEKAIRDFELDADFPDEFLSDAKEIGVREKWPELLWRAHWQLPGVGQSFEMFQRLRPDRPGPTFTEDNLQTYLKTADIAPFFRDKLTAVAFRVVPRIDIRRLYRADLITFEEMVERNMDFGYTREDALMLAIMVRDEGAEDEREITLSLIQRSYKIKRFNRGEALAALQDLDYSETTADLILDVVDFQVHEDEINDLQKQLEFLFIEGEIEEANVRGRLGGEGLTADEINLFMQRLTIKRNRKVKLPTQGQLEDFYEENIIGRNELEGGLGNIGWNRQRITWFVELLDLRIQRKLQKEAERARDAQEKLSRRVDRRESAILKGEISVQIAEARADIADMKVSARELEDAEEKEALALSILETKAEIAVMQIDLAIVRRDAA